MKSKSKMGAGFVTLLGVLWTSESLFAYPTVWTISNQSGASTSVKCESINLEGLQSQARFVTPMVQSGSTYTHNWGQAWHNDGMGLNSGTFSCQAGQDKKSGDVKSVTFRSEWDESVAISLSRVNGQLTLTKNSQGPREKVARINRQAPSK